MNRAELARWQAKHMARRANWARRKALKLWSDGYLKRFTGIMEWAENMDETALRLMSWADKEIQ